MSKRAKSKNKNRSEKRYLGRKILRILSGAAEALDTLGDFTYNPYPYLYASLGHVYDKGTINDAVTDLVKRGLVEKDESKGVRLVAVGADIKEALYRRRREKWDGKWRVVFFDIPEVQREVRDSLRFELKKLGFGRWQRSAWITPFDIAGELDSYLREQNIAEEVQILVGERCGALNDREFAARVWPVLHEVNEGYRRLLEEWKEEVGRESTAERRLDLAFSLHNRYFDILDDDPQLPAELLPSDWVGGEARGLFKKLRAFLGEGKLF